MRVNESVLTILKYCFLALLYLFLLRVVRVVYLELGGGGRRAGRARRRTETTGSSRVLQNSHAPPASAPGTDAALGASGYGAASAGSAFRTTSTFTPPVPPSSGVAPAAPAPPRAAAPLTRKERRARLAGSVGLVVVEPPEQAGRVYDVVDEITIGRASSCQVVLVDDTYVSQVHARVFLHQGRPFLEDLGSTNGTYLNQARVEAVAPRGRGDHVQIGRTLMEVSC